MGQLVNVILTIDKVHTAPQKILDYGPGLGGLNQVYGTNHPTLEHYGRVSSTMQDFTSENSAVRGIHWVSEKE